MPFEVLQLVIGKPQPPQMVGTGLFGRCCAPRSPVKILEAVLRQVCLGCTVGRGHMIQRTGITQRQIIAHNGFQEQESAVAICHGMEHFQIDPCPEITHPVDELVPALRYIQGGAGFFVFLLGKGDLIGGFKIMPEQPPMQCHLKLRPFLCRAAYCFIEFFRVDVLRQCAGDPEHPGVSACGCGQKDLCNVINFIPGLCHRTPRFLCLPAGSLHQPLHKPSGGFHRYFGAMDRHLLEHMPAFFIHFQLGIAAGLLQGFDQAFTVGT